MANNDLSTFGALVKKVYAGRVTQLVPDNTKDFFNLVPFVSPQDRLGDKYIEYVNLAPEQGITYAANGAGIVSLETPIAGNGAQAEVDGFQLINSAWLAYDLASKAMKANSKAAFESAMTNVIANLTLGHRRFQVLNMIYGGTDIGAAKSVAGNTITVTDASWAAGIWAGAVGMKVKIFASDYSARRVTTSVVGVDLVNKTITVADATGVLADDVIVPAGARSDAGALTESLGIKAILGVTAGSLFNVDHPLFKGSSVNVGAALSQAVVDEAVTYPMNRGYTGDFVLYVNPAKWGALNAEQVARRRFNGAESTSKTGFSGIVYECQTGGSVTVKSSPWVMEGDGLLIAKNGFKRIGTADIKLGDPLDEDEVVRRIQGKTGYELISYSNQAVFTSAPGNSVLLSGIA